MAETDPTGFPMPPNEHVRTGPDGASPIAPGQAFTGKARFDQLIANAPTGYEKDSYAYNEWILSQPEDINDLEYTRLLRRAKSWARFHESKRSAGQGSMRYELTGLKGAGREPGPRPKGAPDYMVGALPGVGLGEAAGRESRRTGKTAGEESNYRKSVDGVPIVEGLPASAEYVLGDPDNPGGEPDAFLQAYVNGTGLPVDDQRAKAAARSGNWVYAGQVDDPQGGKGFKRDLYMFVDDAKAQIANMDPNKIKAYQAKLGNPVTGVLDQDLISIWDEAVKRAARYAQAGKKVEVQFLFDMLMSAEVASGGRGGGGGGRFAGESGADMAGADYYQAMMQVLGDISGVKS